MAINRIDCQGRPKGILEWAQALLCTATVAGAGFGGGCLYMSQQSGLDLLTLPAVPAGEGQPGNDRKGIEEVLLTQEINQQMMERFERSTNGRLDQLAEGLETLHRQLVAGFGSSPVDNAFEELPLFKGRGPGSKERGPGKPGDEEEAPDKPEMRGPSLGLPTAGQDQDVDGVQSNKRRR